MDIVFHYPPELTQLLIDTIPLLCRSKPDVLLFFEGAGLGNSTLADLKVRVLTDRQSINKYEIVREILRRINESGESALRERREILKRVTELDDFSTCWPTDQLKAKGLVSEIRRVVDVKDSFTRMKQEVEKSQSAKAAEYRKRMEEQEKRRSKIADVRNSLFSLFSALSPQERGKKLEAVLNALFSTHGILIREAFTILAPELGGIYEQVDGAINLDNEVYLVEMKWLSEPVGKEAISSHLVRVYHRGYSRGIHISTHGYTEPAIQIARESLQRTVFILIGLDEITHLLEQERDLSEMLRIKVHSAILEKNPWKR